MWKVNVQNIRKGDLLIERWEYSSQGAEAKMYERYIKDRKGLLRPSTAHPYLGHHQLSPGWWTTLSLSPPYPTGQNFLPIWSLTGFIKIFTTWLDDVIFLLKAHFRCSFSPLSSPSRKAFTRPTHGGSAHHSPLGKPHWLSHSSWAFHVSFHTSRSPWHIPFSPSKCLLSFTC